MALSCFLLASFKAIALLSLTPMLAPHFHQPKFFCPEFTSHFLTVFALPSSFTCVQGRGVVSGKGQRHVDKCVHRCMGANTQVAVKG